MPKVLLKRIPKKTDRKKQSETMQQWAQALTSKYPPTDGIPAISAKKHKSQTSSTK